MFRRILVLLDGTARSEPALNAAVDLAKTRGAALVLAATFEHSGGTSTIESAHGASLVPGDERDLRQAWQAYLEEMASRGRNESL